jgi:hypothetical protein
VFYELLADSVVVAHVGYMAFVLLGQLAILVGFLAHWDWVRNFWFRVIHFTMIGVVAVESIFDVTCPLTTWERDLRTAAGQESDQHISFIGRLFHDILFYQVPADMEWIFSACYIAFALLVLATLVIVPPRLPRKRSDEAPPSASVSPSI